MLMNEYVFVKAAFVYVYVCVFVRLRVTCVNDCMRTCVFAFVFCLY